MSINMHAYDIAADDKSAKRVRCGECRGCMGDDCGHCANCADKPKFGGAGALQDETPRLRPPLSRRGIHYMERHEPGFRTCAGIKKQACFARKCIYVKLNPDSTAAPMGSRKRTKQNSGIPALFHDPASFCDEVGAHVNPSPATRT